MHTSISLHPRIALGIKKNNASFGFDFSRPFQFIRSNSAMRGGSSDPAIIVQGAFTGGGAHVGNSGTLANRWELTNTSTFTRAAHTMKWGARVRQSFTDSTSMSDFGASLDQSVITTLLGRGARRHSRTLGHTEHTQRRGGRLQGQRVRCSQGNPSSGPDRR